VVSAGFGLAESFSVTLLGVCWLASFAALACVVFHWAVLDGLACLADLAVVACLAA
jgi:hypothetical protein